MKSIYKTYYGQCSGLDCREFKDVNDKRVLWDLIKYRIRQVSMRYSKENARLRKEKLLAIETSLNFYQEKCSADPSTENFQQLEILKSKYDAIIFQRVLLFDLERLGMRRAKKTPSTS